MKILLDDSLAKPQTIQLFRKSFPDTYIGVLDGGDRECHLAKYFSDYVQDFRYNTSEEYVERLDEYLRNNQWDIFVPRRFLPDIPQQIGHTKIMIDNPSAVSVADNKCSTYVSLEQEPSFADLIPRYVDGASQAFSKNIISQLLKGGTDIMIKKKVDIGGESYRKLTDIKQHMVTDSYIQDIHDQINIMCGGRYDEYMIGEVLIDHMISVDVFSDCAGKIFTVKRLKIDDLRILYEEDDLNGICERLYSYFGFQYAVNMQFMRSKTDGRLKLLEVNPRISGGIHMSSKLIETNIPKVLVAKLMGLHDIEGADFTPKHKIVADIPQIQVLL